MKQFRWALAVTGSQFDLDDAVSVFGEQSDPSVRVIELPEGKDGELVTTAILTSPQMEELDGIDQVQGVARRLLALVNGALFVADPVREPLIASSLRKRRTNGGWDIIIVPGTAQAERRGRARAVGAAIVGGEPAPQFTLPAPPTRWVAAAQSDQVIADVLTFLRGEPDWFDLWKVFEIIRKSRSGQRRQNPMRWPSPSDEEHFRCSVGVYRHPPPWNGGYTPEKAMKLTEARRFVQSLTSDWLTWRLSMGASPRASSAVAPDH